MIKTVTRSVLADAVYKEIGISHAESSELVDITFDELINGMIKSGVVKIASFGSFYIKEKRERIGRNPRNKKEAIIKARKVVSFYPSNILKEKINS